MRVLMYGWEFPPNNQGGLGAACEGIVRGLIENDVKVHLVLPYHDPSQSQDFEIHKGIGNSNVKVKYINSPLQAYQTPSTYIETKKKGESSLYGKNLFHEVERYKHEASKHAKKLEHDVIHAHDWMTYPAAVEAKKHSKKPLVLHIHATEFDRSGDNPNQLVYEIEKLGFENADKIIAVSELTKYKLVSHYNIEPEKIVVIHNAITQEYLDMQTKTFNNGKKTVLFLGRMTMQKGPEYFLEAAAKVLKLEANTNFLMAGDGDMMGQMIELALKLGIEKNVLFTGFLRGADIDRAFQSADLFVMPSVSEPFGLVALEAIKNGTPVLISKQSGAAEVIPNALKADFWDIDSIANQIVMALRHPEMTKELKRNAEKDMKALTWNQQSKEIKNLYQSL